MDNLIQHIILGCFYRPSYKYAPCNDPVEHPSTIGHAVGVIRIVIQAANIKKTSFRKPRPFVLIGMRGDPQMHHRTSVLKEKTLSPNWMSESTDVIVYSLKDNLQFQVMNQHMFFAPSLVGLASFPLDILQIESGQINAERPIRSVNPAKFDSSGTLLFDIFYYPVTLDSRVEFSSSEIPISSEWPSHSGVVTLNIQQATNFILDNNLKPSRLVAAVSMGWTKMPIHTTIASAFMNQTLVWNSSFDFICYDKAQTIIVIKLTDDTNSCGSKSPLIYGHVSVALDELTIAQDEKERVSWPLSGCPHGSLTMSAQWKPINQLKSSRIYTPSKG